MSLRDRSEPGRAAVALSRRRPALWHCTFMGAWPQIQAYGLLSVARLIELANFPVAQRQQLMLMPRADVWRIPLPNGGQALLRDQHPLHSRRLHHYLDEMSQEQWLQLLNARAFLFTQEFHVQRLIKAYSDQGQDVLKLKTASLLAAYEGQVEVTTRNSGALPRDQVAAIQEVTILVGVERIEPFVTNVIRYHPDGSRRRIWP